MEAFEHEPTWEELVMATTVGVKMTVPAPFVPYVWERVPGDVDASVVASVVRNTGIAESFARHVCDLQAPWLYDFFKEVPEYWDQAWPDEFYWRIAKEKWSKKYGGLDRQQVANLKKRGLRLSADFWFKLTQHTKSLEARVECYAAMHFELGLIDQYFRKYGWNGVVKGAPVGCP